MQQVDSSRAFSFRQFQKKDLDRLDPGRGRRTDRRDDRASMGPGDLPMGPAQAHSG